MDPGSIALLIPVVAILSGAAVTIAKDRAGRPGVSGSPEDGARLDALEEEMGHMRQELTEAQERLDFAERLLAKGRDGNKLAAELPRQVT